MISPYGIANKAKDRQATNICKNIFLFRNIMITNVDNSKSKA